MGFGVLGAVFLVLTGVEALCAANLLKTIHGGWFPLLIGAVIFTLLTTWKTGRRILRAKLESASLPLHLFLEEVWQHPPGRVPGRAVFMAGNPEGTPLALLHNLKHNRILHECNVVLTVVTDGVPYVEAARRVQVERWFCLWGHLMGMSSSNPARVLVRGEQTQKPGWFGEAEFEEPPGSIRVGVHQGGIVNDSLIGFDDLAAEWGIDVTGGLDRFDYSTAFTGLELAAYCWQFDENDVSQFLLGVVSDAHRRDIAGHADPLMRLGVP